MEVMAASTSALCRPVRAAASAAAWSPATGVSARQLRRCRGLGASPAGLALRAQGGDTTGRGGSSSSEEAEEARVAALEAGAKKRKAGSGAKSVMAAQQTAAQQQAAPPGFAEWKEGEVFPEGWEKMDPMQKAGELWAGKRGAMYWMTQSAYYSAIIIAFAWVLFRFVLPAIGVYDLASGLTGPPP